LSKIAIIVWEFPPGPGGIGQHAYSMGLALASRNHNVSVLTTSDYASPKEIKYFDLHNPQLSVRRIKRLSIIGQLHRIISCIRMIRREDPDTIILTGKASLWLASIIRLLSKNRKLTAFLHGSEIHLKSYLARQITYSSLLLMDKVFCVSKFTETLLPIQLRKRLQVSIVSNGLNINQLAQSPKSYFDPIRAKGTPRLLTVGNITRRKGQHRVIQALPHLRSIWPSIHYHMVGIPTAYEETIALADRLGVRSNISIHGRIGSRTELYNAYNSADVFIMLSENQKNGDVEGFGIAILEANYFGLAAIGASGCGIEDAIQDGVNGYLVNGDDPRDIENALRKCLASSTLPDSAKKWAIAHDWDALIDKVI
jgi:phosphatidyl-myo-inositol dimannoside synthase